MRGNRAIRPAEAACPAHSEMMVKSVANGGKRPLAGGGWTLPELLAVIILVAALLLVALLAVGRGKATADELACDDNIKSIHTALETYWVKNNRTYPADQATFEQFLQDPAYFTEEPRCPLDDAGAYHYLYGYDPATAPGPEGITISCPVPESGHG